jgi:hypothetical protein
MPDVFEPFPKGSFVPTAVAQDVQMKQPMLLYFFDGTQYTSKANRKIIDTVTSKNRGLVDVFTYDLGKHFSGTAADPAQVDASYAKDTAYQQAVALARSLSVSNTPFIIITDSQGYIIWEFRGLTDRDLLEQQILRASN